MKKIEKIVYEIAGEEVVMEVGERGVTDISYYEKRNSYKVYKQDEADADKHILYKEIFDVKVVCYDVTSPSTNKSFFKS